MLMSLPSLHCLSYLVETGLEHYVLFRTTRRLRYCSAESGLIIKPTGLADCVLFHCGVL